MSVVTAPAETATDLATIELSAIDVADVAAIDLPKIELPLALGPSTERPASREASAEARTAMRAATLERAPALGKWMWARKLLWLLLVAVTTGACALPVILGPTDAEPDFATAILMWAVTLAIGVASFVLPKRWLLQSVDSIDLVFFDEIAVAGDYRSTRTRRRVVALDTASQERLRRATFTPFAMSLALPTALALLGLLLGRLGHESLMCAPLSLLGALLVMARCPTRYALANDIAHALDADVEL